MQDELFVCGRLKELMIVRGKNYYPQDIEHAAQAADERLARGSGVAFSLEHGGQEHVFLVQELRREAYRQGISTDDEDRVVAAVTARCGLRLKFISFVKPGTLPRTTSGKLQRTAVKTEFARTLLSSVEVE